MYASVARALLSITMFSMGTPISDSMLLKRSSMPSLSNRIIRWSRSCFWTIVPSEFQMWPLPTLLGTPQVLHTLTLDIQAQLPESIGRLTGLLAYYMNASGVVTQARARGGFLDFRARREVI